MEIHQLQNQFYHDKEKLSNPKLIFSIFSKSFCIFGKFDESDPSLLRSVSVGSQCKWKCALLSIILSYFSRHKSDPSLLRSISWRTQSKWIKMGAFKYHFTLLFKPKVRPLTFEISFSRKSMQMKMLLSIILPHFSR